MDILPQDISALLGLDALPEKEKNEMLAKVAELLHQAIIARALTVMSAQMQNEFEKLLGGNPKPEEVAGFLQASVPDFSEIVEEEIKRFKEESVTVMSALK